MWRRIKRLINSRLDNLIEKSDRAASGVREVTRSEVVRLNELEVQSAASAKLLEKELAALELKLVGLFERERILRERGAISAATEAANSAAALSAQRDLVKGQLAQARASASRAHELRDERRRSGKELATETHLTSMREDIAGLGGSFDAADPSTVIDEMKARIERSRSLHPDDSVADANRELEAEQRRIQADEMLARYKSSSDPSTPAPPPPSVAKDKTAAPTSEKAAGDESSPQEGKSLGPSEGPVRPID